jgi:hypothetical protein
LLSGGKVDDGTVFGHTVYGDQVLIGVTKAVVGTGTTEVIGNDVGTDFNGITTIDGDPGTGTYGTELGTIETGTITGVWFEIDGGRVIDDGTIDGM